MSESNKPEPPEDRAENRSELPTDDEVDAALDSLIASQKPKADTP